MTVSEADRIKAVERVRADMSPIFGGTPSYKRKRGIYRALKRGDVSVTIRFQFILAQFKMMQQLCNSLFVDSNCRDNEAWSVSWKFINGELEK